MNASAVSLDPSEKQKEKDIQWDRLSDEYDGEVVYNGMQVGSLE